MNFKRIKATMIAGVTAVLAAVVLVSPGAVSANSAKQHRAQGFVPTYCNMWNVGQTCKTPYNYFFVHYVTNGGGGGSASVYCFAHHTDGSWTGGAVTVHPGETKGITPSGYNQAVCTMNGDGGGGFPINIHSYS